MEKFTKETKRIYNYLQEIQHQKNNKITIKNVTFNATENHIKDLKKMSFDKIKKVVIWVNNNIKPYAKEDDVTNKYSSDELRYDYDSIVGEYIANHELIAILLLMDIKGEVGHFNINVKFYLDKKYKKLCLGK